MALSRLSLGQVLTECRAAFACIVARQRLRIVGSSRWQRTAVARGEGVEVEVGERGVVRLECLECVVWRAEDKEAAGICSVGRRAMGRDSSGARGGTGASGRGVAGMHPGPWAGLLT